MATLRAVPWRHHSDGMAFVSAHSRKKRKKERIIDPTSMLVVALQCVVVVVPAIAKVSPNSMYVHSSQQLDVVAAGRLHHHCASPIGWRGAEPPPPLLTAGI